MFTWLLCILIAVRLKNGHIIFFLSISNIFVVWFLQYSPSRGEVYFLNTWIWARLVTCFDLWNVANNQKKFTVSELGSERSLFAFSEPHDHHVNKSGLPKGWWEMHGPSILSPSCYPFNSQKQSCIADLIFQLKYPSSQICEWAQLRSEEPLM